MSTNLNISLHPSEIVILKSMALGMGCQMIQKLLEINSIDYERFCSSLFAKLNVSNPYAAVRIAFRKKIISEKEYSIEAIKSLALEFATQRMNDLEQVKGDQKQLLWVFYDLLVEFEIQVEDYFLSNQIFVRK
ncbi:MAG: hypothetical protein PVJ91_06015 [Flavobacteriaceae bacterium]|jgi:hypothetical protein